MKPPESR